MIRHVAMFTWTQDATREQIQACVAQMATMPDNIDFIRRYEHGEDLGLRAGTADYVLVADFDSVEDYWSYSGHPYHVDWIERYAKHIVASVARVQHTLVS